MHQCSPTFSMQTRGDAVLERLKRRILSLIQLFLVLVFIVFEELVWEGIAYPVYRYVHSLQILQKIELQLQRVSRYVILVLFMLMFVSVEILGIYAGLSFVRGRVALGLGIYLAKIPIAAFTFWMFRVTEEKLMRFGWFKWLYTLLMRAIAWIKSRKVYESTMQRIDRVRHRMRVWIRAFKIKNFASSSGFSWRIKQLYYEIKRLIKRQ